MGDGVLDFESYQYLDNVYLVSGNCDIFSQESNERLIELGGKKIFITHGNRYKVKLGLTYLIDKAKELGANFVFYGHTHIQKIEQIDNIYFINPGKFGRNFENKSRGLIVTIDKNSTNIEPFEV